MLDEKLFWDYAVKLYGQSGVTDVCLKLQDELGLNVNLLLLLCYCEQNRLQLSGDDIEMLTQSVTRWHSEYTKPLRAIRRKLALDDGATLESKQTIFDAEMALEKIEQRLLVSCFNQLQPSKAQHAHNLQRYIGFNDNKAPLQYAGAIEHLRSVLS